MTALDDYFLPGVSFTLDGETLPARELVWAMYAACGCITGMHMMTVDSITEAAAWKLMSGNAQMIKQDKARGFTIKMAKHRGLPFDDCPHSPKWGYMPTPIPPSHSWATTRTGRVLHLVPLTAAEKTAEGKDPDPEWAEDDKTWSTKASSLCGKAAEPIRVWSRKPWSVDGKPDCARCAQVAERQVLL